MNNINKTTTIIIVNYNSFRLLKNCLDSIEKHIIESIYEVIVIDNNSSQGDIEEITNAFSFVKLVKNTQNEGFARANNKALGYVRTEYVLFLNNDTVFIENSIQKILSSDLMLTESLVGIRLLFPDKQFQESAFRTFTITRLLAANFFLDRVFPDKAKLSKNYSGIENFSEPTNVDYVIGAFIFSKTDFVKKLSGFDDRFFFYHEDSDICLRAKKMGGRVIYFPETEVIHVGGGSTNQMLRFQTRRRHIARIQFFQKHFSKFQYLLALLIEYSGVILRIPIFFIFGVLSMNKNYLKRALFYTELIFTFPADQFRE